MGDADSFSLQCHKREISAMGLSTSIVLFLYSPSINSFKGANFKRISLVTIMMVLTHSLEVNGLKKITKVAAALHNLTAVLQRSEGRGT